MTTENHSIKISESLGAVSAEVIRPDKMKALLVLAHGAGAGMNHSFMTALANALAEGGIGTLRYNFPYMEKKKNRPDPPAVAEKTVEEVIKNASTLFPGVPLIAGGKSFGGRMTSGFVSKHGSTPLKGLVFYGFPLHAPGNPSMERADHLKQIQLPMLFLQGSRDALAELSLLKKVTAALSTATVEIFDGADHSFKAGKKVLIPELAERTIRWFEQHG
jgi:uncharacterized protein